MTERVEVGYGMSLEDYLARCGDDDQFEIIDGEVVPMSPNASLHDTVIRALFRALDRFLSDNAELEVFSKTTIIQYDPSRLDWVKGSLEPDVMVVSKTDLDQAKVTTPDWEKKPYSVVPLLVIEVLSHTDRQPIVFRKIKQYLAIGVQLVWLIDPFERTIKVYRAGQDADHPDVLKESASLTTELLPGFSLPLATLFAD